MSTSGAADPKALSKSWRTSSSSGRSLKSADWENRRATIEELYIGRGLTLEKVRREMAGSYGFDATTRMYKGRLAGWEVGKNVIRQDRLWVAYLLRKRQEAGKTASAVHIRQKLRPAKDCRKFLKEFETVEIDTLAAAVASGKEIAPSYIRCLTPEGSTSEASDQPAGLPPNRPNDAEPSVQLSCPISSSNSSRHGRDHGKTSSFVSLGREEATMQIPSQPNGAAATHRIDPASESFVTLSSIQDAPSIPQGPPCDRLQQDVRTMTEQIANPERLHSFAADLGDLPAWSLCSRCPGSGFLGEVCSRCGYEIAKHDPIPPDFLSVTATELPHNHQPLLGTEAPDYTAFIAACLGACMYGVREEFDVMSLCMVRAMDAYRQMLLDNNPVALQCVNEALLWLHAHDQGPLAGSVIRSALRVAVEVLGEAHDITRTLEWMTSVAFRKQNECDIKTPMLRDIYMRLKESHGVGHQHTIVAGYNLGYNLIQDKEYKSAEEHLRYLVQTSSHRPGPASLQTVSALNALSRAQARQGNYEMAVATLQESLQHAPLGKSHPFRLATIQRLADILKKLGRVEEEETLRWKVLEGRIATLGPQHANTKRAREELVHSLKGLGKWAVMEREVEKLFETTKPRSQDMTKDEDAWRRVVVEGGCRVDR